MRYLLVAMCSVAGLTVLSAYLASCDRGEVRENGRVYDHSLARSLPAQDSQSVTSGRPQYELKRDNADETYDCCPEVLPPQFREYLESIESREVLDYGAYDEWIPSDVLKKLGRVEGRGFRSFEGCQFVQVHLRSPFSEGVALVFYNSNGQVLDRVVFGSIAQDDYVYGIASDSNFIHIVNRAKLPPVDAKFTVHTSTDTFVVDRWEYLFLHCEQCWSKAYGFRLGYDGYTVDTVK